MESHLNTCCRRPANRIPELCAPITLADPRSRDLFTPADPPCPTSGSSEAPPCPESVNPRRLGPGGTHRPRGCPPPPRSRGTEEEGLPARGRPPLHNRLGALARRPHPAAGGGDPRAEDRTRLPLLEAGGVGGAGGGPQ